MGGAVRPPIVPFLVFRRFWRFMTQPFATCVQCVTGAVSGTFILVRSPSVPKEFHRKGDVAYGIRQPYLLSFTVL